MPAIQGVATSVDRLDSTVAPAKAPTAPGNPMRATTDQSTLRKRQCAVPEARVVPISARCTEADAEAGESPATRSREVDVTP